MVMRGRVAGAEHFSAVVGGRVRKQRRGKEIRRRVVIAADCIRTFWENGTYFDMSKLTIRFLGAKSALRTIWEIVIENA